MNSKLTYIYLLILSFFQINACKAQEEGSKKMSDTPKSYTNNLIHEKSPYLLQHSHNPVNWYPWSEEAFNLAKKENKPIFLSIGYSTCHWCHVMEHESFEDEEVAKLMNDVFISIKVDREERPDIDKIYMTVCQMMTGSGGWPLTVIMTPEQKPFYAATYIPKFSRGNRVGMLDLIKRIDKAWKEQNENIRKSANEITGYLNSPPIINDNEPLSSDILTKAYSSFDKRFDKKFGGFGEKPKFPSPHNNLFLLREYASTGNKNALEMVTKTLTEMRKGGIFDQIGFGFHRYSPDKNWFLPHFEKMLYDQAMLTIAYTETFQITKNKTFKQTTEEIIEYVLRDLTSKNGGFFSAEDADSEGEEGKFYLWENKEIIKLLGKQDGEFITSIFNADTNGNYFEEASQHSTGTNILFLNKNYKELSKQFGISEYDLEKKINELRVKLFIEREKRIHPYKDDKILTDWNGLMIVALAKAGRVLNNKKYMLAAEKSAEFIFSKLVDSNGNLLHRFRENEAAINAQIDDYAFLIWGLIELYESTFDVTYLKKSIELTDILLNKYWDKENNSGFYFTPIDDSKLISRPIEFYDGAIPSGNSVMYLNLQKLNKLTSNIIYDKYANKLQSAFKELVEKAPTGFSQFLTGYQFSHYKSFEIIIVGEKNSKETIEILEVINSQFIPNKVIMLIDNKNKNEIIDIAPFTKDYTMIDNKTTVYVCENYTCSLPTNDKNKVIELLSK